MLQTRKQNRQKFYLFSFIGLLLLAGLCTGLVYYVDYLQNLDETVDLGAIAELPTLTPTFTPRPTKTPTPSITPTPTITPSPTATPTPVPLGVSVSGPVSIPRGLPNAAEWRIAVEQGNGAVVVSIENLRGVLLTGDEEGQLYLAKTIASEGTSSTAAAFDTEWVISGILDPNVGQGSITFLLETTVESETITLPWQVTDNPEIKIQHHQNPIDGISPEISLPSADETALATLEPPPDGYTRFASRSRLQIIHPDTWFATEFQDGTLQISAEPIAGDGSTPAETSYMSIIAGDLFAVGLPEEVSLTAEAITTWLLGDFTIVGGENGGIFVSTELEVLNQYQLDYSDGRYALVTELIPTTNISTSDFVAYLAVSVSDNDIYILNGFIPEDRDDAPTFQTMIESIQFDPTN